MDMYQKRKIRAEKKNNDNDKSKVRLNCEKPIYINIHSNHWKYWIFNIEIFTFFKINKKLKGF